MNLQLTAYLLDEGKLVSRIDVDREAPVALHVVETQDELRDAVSRDGSRVACVLMMAEEETLNAVRAWLEPTVPIIAILAPDRIDAASALAAGADDVIVGDVTYPVLRARLDTHARRVEEAHAFEALAEDAEALVELTQRLTSSLDFREILFSVVQRVASTIGAARISIVLAPESGDGSSSDTGYVMVASDDETLTDLELDLANYPEIREVLRTRRPLTIEDVSTHPMLAGISMGEEPGAMVLVPIVWESQVIGVFFLRLENRHRRLTERELRYCRAVAGATAVALRNARVMQSLRDETQEVSFARFEAERRLEGLQRYAELFASAAEGIAVLAEDGTVLFANPRAYEVLGITEELMDGLRIRDLIVEEDRDKARALWTGFGAGVFPRGVDLRLHRPDGSQVTLCSSFAPLAIGDAKVLISCHDVTEHRATEQELVKTMEFLESLIDASVEGVVAADMSDNVILFNPAAERIFGFLASEVVGRMSMSDLFDGTGAQLVREGVMSETSGGYGRLHPTRVDARGARNALIPVQLSAALIFEEGEPSAFFVILTDLREKIRTERRLAEAHEQLERSEKQAMLAELAGTAAHELNQPLTSIMAYAELLERKLDPESPEYRAARTMLDEAQRMADIVRKIGKVTEYETREYVGEQKILDLDRAARDSNPNPVDEA